MRASWAIPLCICACGAAPSSTVVEVPPLALPPSPPPAQVTVRPLENAARGPCSAPASLDSCEEIGRVRVDSIELSSPTCYVDLKVASGEVGRVLRCRTGAAVVFDRVVYGGTFDGDVVDACVETTFPFDDGCTWKSLQRIRGVRGALAGLSLSYAERPVLGSGCAPSSCTAIAPLEWVAP